mmetsp:Transcript_30716/g.80404  ORF Transcript_30716/g.80404 Transcript_30716/m.80404 type:complete len:565 (+) Transcript_30716:27-1721(+)
MRVATSRRATFLLAVVAAVEVDGRVAVQPIHKTASVTISPSGSFEVKAGVLDPTSTAWGSFENGLNITGWGVLDVRTNGRYSDAEQHRAAGIVEGVLTADQIYPTYLNNLAFTFRGTPPAKVVQFLAAQETWAKAQVQAAKSSDPFWTHVGSVLSQFDGLVEGYNHVVSQGHVPPVSRFGFQMLNAIGDLFQIVPAVEQSRRLDWGAMSRSEIVAALKKAGHCSALIKVTGAYDDLFMSHSSWFEYANMNRIFKHYHFEFSTPAGANRISFSSYPGYLESLDDFYMMDSGLGMVQTSNGVMNNSLYDLITPSSLLAWQRVRVASAIASTGEEWWNAFRTNASGTYVNQYMVVDFKKFTPAQALKPGTLWVVEEIPGLVAGGDQTETLERGYWPSYNVPFYGEVYSRSGYSAHLDRAAGRDNAGIITNGLGPEYQIGAPRSQIFRRDQGKVVDMTSFKELLRYANYSDPIAVSNGHVDYGAALCMRGDLSDGGKGGAGGCYDTKVTSWRHGFFNLTCEAVNGPSSTASTRGSTNPPFAWRPSDGSHVGLPSIYNFPFTRIAPRAL